MQQFETAGVLAALDEFVRVAPTVDDIIDRMLDTCAETAHADRASVVNIGSAEAQVATTFGEARARPAGASWPIDRVALSGAFSGVECCYNSDHRLSAVNENHRRLLEVDLLSSVNVPMYAGPRLVATLNVASRNAHGFTRDDLEILPALVRVASVEINRRRTPPR